MTTLRVGAKIQSIRGRDAGFPPLPLTVREIRPDGWITFAWPDGVECADFQDPADYIEVGVG